MAKPKIIATIVCLTAIFAAAALPRLTAQSSAPAPAPLLPLYPPAPGPSTVMAPSPGPDCFEYLINLSDCLTFVEGGSNLTKPDPGCCPKLANLVNTQPVCLCKLLGNSSEVGISVDVNRALKLPSVCNVTTPPVSLCAAIGIPIGALTPSEAPSDGGSVAATPAPGSGDNGSASNLASKHHFLIGLAAVLSTYFF